MAICLWRGEQALDPWCGSIENADDLSTGEKAAVGISSVIAAVCLCIVFFYWLRDRRKQRLNVGVAKPASTITPREGGVELRDREPCSQPNSSHSDSPPPYSV